MLLRDRRSDVHLLGSKAHTGLGLSNELNPSLLQRASNLFDRLELSVDAACHSLNPADGCDADAGCNSQLKLLPSNQTTPGFDLACPNKHSVTPYLLSILCTKTKSKCRNAAPRGGGLKGGDDRSPPPNSCDRERSLLGFACGAARRRIAHERPARKEFGEWNLLESWRQPLNPRRAEISIARSQGASGQHQVAIFPGRELLGNIGKCLTQVLYFMPLVVPDFPSAF